MALTWRKSSRSSGAAGSGNTNDCVEIAFGAAGPLVRDSKTGDRGPTVGLSRSAFDALLETVKDADAGR